MEKGAVVLYEVNASTMVTYPDMAELILHYDTRVGRRKPAIDASDVLKV